MGYIDNQAEAAHAISTGNGFWDEEVTAAFILAKLALIHSEVTETLEAIRKEKGPDAIIEEMADVYIRLIDLYQGMKMSGWLPADSSLGAIVEKKMAFNATRPRKHGNLA